MDKPQPERLRRARDARAGNSRYHIPGTGSNTANWQFSGLASGNYTVQVSWPSGTNRADNAAYQIYDGTKLLATVVVNQKASPTGTTVSGKVFQTLGTFAVTSGNLHVVLSDNADGSVFADAIRIVAA
jgi:hypothetical protein